MQDSEGFHSPWSQDLKLRPSAYGPTAIRLCDLWPVDTSWVQRIATIRANPSWWYFACRPKIVGAAIANIQSGNPPSLPICRRSPSNDRMPRWLRRNQSGRNATNNHASSCHQTRRAQHGPRSSVTPSRSKPWSTALFTTPTSSPSKAIPTASRTNTKKWEPPMKPAKPRSIQPS